MQIQPSSEKIGRIGVPRIIGLALVLTAVATGCGFGLNRHTEDPEQAAAILNVSVPQSASDISSYTDSSAQGNCTDLSFLLPTNQWQDYVENYFREQLRPSAAEGYSCDDPRPPCKSRPAGKVSEHLKGEDTIRVDNSSQYRALLVIAECFPGQTLISWKTDDV